MVHAEEHLVIAEVTHVHAWVRISRQGRCDCGHCKMPDSRGLECDTCIARLNPGDPGFEEIYELASWWWDIL